MQYMPRNAWNQTMLSDYLRDIYIYVFIYIYIIYADFVKHSWKLFQAKKRIRKLNMTFVYRFADSMFIIVVTLKSFPQYAPLEENRCKYCNNIQNIQALFWHVCIHLVYPSSSWIFSLAQLKKNDSGIWALIHMNSQTNATVFFSYFKTVS